MYVQNTNPIAIRTQQMISQALIRLMQRTSYQQITVTDLCREADIGRKTFYRHFQWMEDVIDFQLDQLYAEYEEDLHTLSLEQYLPHHFAFLERHIDYLKLLYQNELLDHLSAKFNCLLPQVMPQWSPDPMKQEYLSAYISAGVNAMIHTWVARDFAESVDEIVAMAVQSQGVSSPLP